jgi:hypothetical protein
MATQISGGAIGAHRDTLRTLSGRLAAPNAAEQRDALKEEIISLFKEIE